MILYEDWRDLLRIFLCAKGEGIHIPLNEWSDRIGLLRKGGNQRCEYGNMPVLTEHEAKALFINARQGTKLPASS